MSWVVGFPFLYLISTVKLSRPQPSLPVTSEVQQQITQEEGLVFLKLNLNLNLMCVCVFFIKISLICLIGENRLKGKFFYLICQT
jgi:hypothetical protein